MISPKEFLILQDCRWIQGYKQKGKGNKSKENWGQLGSAIV